MEGTVTISIQDFDRLRKDKEKLDYVKAVINESIKDGKFEVKGHEAIRMIDYIAEKVFDI